MNYYGRLEENTGRCFMRALSYPRAPAIRVFREARPRRRFPWTERHLQCVWYDPALRPARLPVSSGEWIEVENPGVWNTEEGPDFIGAVVRVEPHLRRVAGDVEIHIAPEDWDLHGHANDPRYANVRLHVTFFPGDGGPSGAIHVVMNDALQQHLRGDLECIDVTAYPYAARGTPPPCAEAIAAWDADRIEAFLSAAGEERLRRKAERMVAQIETCGAEQTFYMELMTALGYKHNKNPCRRLAEAVPVARLREMSQNDPCRAYALLAGVAGLLPATDSARWDSGTREWWRQLWDHWWRRRDVFEHRILTRELWRLGGIRPMNHPARRLMAAAVFFTANSNLVGYWRHMAEAAPRGVIHRFVQSWLALRDPYFSTHCSFGGKSLKRPVSLIGRERAEAMAVNVLVPFLAALGTEKVFAGGLLDTLPRGEENAWVRQTAHALLGRDHPPSLYRTGLRRQGLLQVFQDYCLNDRSRCIACPLPALLQRTSAHAEDLATGPHF